MIYVGLKTEWMASADYVTSWVAAITVDVAKDGKVEGSNADVGFFGKGFKFSCSQYFERWWYQTMDVEML